MTITPELLTELKRKVRGVSWAIAEKNKTPEDVTKLLDDITYCLNSMPELIEGYEALRQQLQTEKIRLAEEQRFSKTDNTDVCRHSLLGVIPELNRPLSMPVDRRGVTATTRLNRIHQLGRDDHLTGLIDGMADVSEAVQAKQIVFKHKVNASHRSSWRNHGGVGENCQIGGQA